MSTIQVWLVREFEFLLLLGCCCCCCCSIPHGGHRKEKGGNCFHHHQEEPGAVPLARMSFFESCCLECMPSYAQ